MGGVDVAEEEAGGLGFGVDGGGVRDGDGEGVEEGGVAFGRGRRRGGQVRRVDALGDVLEAFRAVIDGIHAGDDGEEDLGGADVAGGLVAADVLLAGLQAEAHGGVAVAVDADADEAAGQLAFEFVFHGHEGGVGTAAAHGDAEALGAADGDVGAPFAGGLQKGEGEEVGGGDNRARRRRGRR